MVLEFERQKLWFEERVGELERRGRGLQVENEMLKGELGRVRGGGRGGREERGGR